MPSKKFPNPTKLQAVLRYLQTCSKSLSGGGYLHLRWASHPLSSTDGNAYIPRTVAYAKYKGIDPVCHYCRKPLRWKSDDWSDLATGEHLNGNKLDNSPRNIEVACNPCNIGNNTQKSAYRHARNMKKLLAGKRIFNLAA
jgi:hypothetical protein